MYACLKVCVFRKDGDVFCTYCGATKELSYLNFGLIKCKELSACGMDCAACMQLAIYGTCRNIEYCITVTVGYCETIVLVAVVGTVTREGKLPVSKV